MRNYLVTFSKAVLDGAGHDRRVVQQQAVIQSLSELSAAWEAKALFCSVAGIVDWRMRADTCEVAEIADVAASVVIRTEAATPRNTSADQWLERATDH